MSLSLALNTALSGLNVTQKQLAVLSDNIANANNEAYSRKIATQRAEYLAGNGAGASLESITRRVDLFLINNIRAQSSVVGRTDFVRDYMDRTQLLFGNPGLGNSINSYITTFFNTLQSLTQTPEDASLKATAIQNAQSFVSQINKLARDLQDLRKTADESLKEYVPIINNDILQVDALNVTIAQERGQGRPVTELEDRRDAFLRDMAQYIDIQTYVSANGAVNISSNSVALLDQSVYQLSYNSVGSATAFVDNVSLSPLNVYRSDADGNLLGSPVTMITGTTSAEVSTTLTGGKIKGVLDIRDRYIPQMLAQLDVLAAKFRDEFNAIHNKGSGYPGAYSLTGTQAYTADNQSEWSGKVRIAVLDGNGQPIPSGYSGELNGFPPLLMDLGSLNGGDGAGKPTVQSIIDEINSYYGTPQKKVSLGNLSNIQIASNSKKIPGVPPLFSFDLDLQNISSSDSQVVVTGIQVLDDTDADITSVSQNVPDIDIDATNGFVTTSGSGTITINTTAAHGLAEGDVIFLRDITSAILPATDLGGIDLSQLNDQYFTVGTVTDTSFQITVASGTATSSGAVASTGATLLSAYSEVEAGEQKRTTAQGTIDVNLTGNPTSDYYTIKLNVGVIAEDGTISTSQISYRIDPASHTLNRRYPPRTATGDGEIVPPESTQKAMTAMLVDASGNELAKVNDQYITSEEGFLKLVAGNSSYVIAIDSLDSEEGGLPDAVPPVDATNRGFSHYFALNNFFVDDGAVEGVANSALNLEIEQRFADNPNLLATGQLSAVYNASGTLPTYGYQRTTGDQTIMLQLANLANTTLSFQAAGGVGGIAQTLGGYSAQIISAASSNATAAKQNNENAQLLADGFTQRSRSISGVNLDEELANTVLFQNAYSASARIISVVKELFDLLSNVF